MQILHNQNETSVSIHQMNEEVDTGKIVIKKIEDLLMKNQN